MYIRWYLVVIFCKRHTYRLFLSGWKVYISEATMAKWVNRIIAHWEKLRYVMRENVPNHIRFQYKPNMIIFNRFEWVWMDSLLHTTPPTAMVRIFGYTIQALVEPECHPLPTHKRLIYVTLENILYPSLYLDPLDPPILQILYSDLTTPTPTQTILWQFYLGFLSYVPIAIIFHPFL